MIRQHAFTLIEAVIVLAILAISFALSFPLLRGESRALEGKLAADELASIFAMARSTALRDNVNVAVRFVVKRRGRVEFALYRDGDGDGVRNADIAKGVDPRISPFHRLRHFGSAVRFGFPPGMRPAAPGDPSRRLSRLDDPIRFNRSDLASFSPLGGATPGSLYFTAGRRELWVVRLLGRTGRVRVLHYDPASRRWKH